MIKIGMMIAQRYEIIDKIGTGGMSDVYKAKDHKLNRFVAIKVLKQEFAENRSFVSKFIVEAQAAAGLMHHNIVNVYDVGEEDGIHFIVMELVEGITLKKYIEKKVRLTSKEAISIAIQVAMGIEAAHNNHIIHRDIKPQNIIISKEGKVKVTDFGIAKAATSNTITSNVMGSVHYTSPEQARGGFSDAKSDIYSLGITMFEMLTGRVPFNGDTAVSIAIKHIQDEMPSPRSFVPEIPVSVEQIIMKCTQKNPDRRYQNMSEIIQDLKHSLIAPDEEFVKMSQVDEVGKTRVVPERPERIAKEQYATEEDLREIPEREESFVKPKEPAKPKKANTAKKPPVNAKKKKKQAPAKKKQAPKPKYQNEFEEDDDKAIDYNPTADKIMTAVTVVLAIVIGCLLLYFAGNAVGLFPEFQPSAENLEQFKLPDCEGKSLEQVEAAFQNSNIKYKVTYQESKKYAVGTVMMVNNAKGKQVEAGSLVSKSEELTLIVSSGADGIVVPDVFGMLEAEATSKLKNEGFKIEKIYEFSDKYPKGNCFAQSLEAGTIVSLESVVTITISKGAEEIFVAMPSVLGKSRDDAIQILTDAGLSIGEIEESYSTEYKQGEICYQSFPTGVSIQEGSVIDLKVSIGIETVYYSCNLVIQAPADFAGGNAVVKLMTADGTQDLWYSETVSSFPLSINLTSFPSTSPYGVVYITYIKNKETVVYDAEGRPSTQMVQEVDSVQQNVSFQMINE